MNHFLFSRIFKHGQAGFSLTEVMVGGAILAGVALAGAQMFRDQKEAQKRLELDQRLSLFHQSLTKILSDTANCNATLQQFYNGPITNQTNLNLYTCTNNCTSDDLKNEANVVVRSSPLFPADPSNNNFRFIDDTQTWKIDQIQLPLTTNRTQTGSILIRVSYSLNPKVLRRIDDGSRVKGITKDIFLNVRFDQSGRFKECYSAQESSLNNLQNDICRSMSSITSTGVVARWNESTQTCEFQTGLKDCVSPGTMIEGVRSDGSVHCKSTTSGFQPNRIEQNTPPETCASGQRVRLVWDSGSKRMRVMCQ